MGSAMAATLVSRGFTVYGYDPDKAATRKAAARGVMVCGDLRMLAAHCPRLITSLPSADALLTVAQTLGEPTDGTSGGARGGTAIAPGLIVAETSTLALEDKNAARRIFAQVGVVMLDCPLSGTGAQARTGDLAVYASGPARAVRTMLPILAGFSRVQFQLGAFGNGTKMKLVANLLVAVHNVAAAEALVLGQRLGLDPVEVVRVVGDGAGTSRMLQIRGPMMAEARWQEATMKVDIWQKDMQIIGEALRRAGAAAPLFAATVPIYTAAQALGHGQHDTASVMAVLQTLSGSGARRDQRA
jgi:3-hydroxyisobutyrate dehydrogenase-like beta-hydroxyacid dehydrogenase